jgi:hypothetical protein
MTRSLLASLFALSLGGCATVSGTPAPASSSSSQSGGSYAAYEPMASPPPAPRKEDVPRLADKEVWVPGYYQPVAGAWIWHQGEVRENKDGYTLVPATTREENGKYLFTPPRWRRADLATQAKK